MASAGGTAVLGSGTMAEGRAERLPMGVSARCINMGLVQKRLVPADDNESLMSKWVDRRVVVAVGAAAPKVGAAGAAVGCGIKLITVGAGS